MKLTFLSQQKRMAFPRPASHATVFLLRSPVLRCAVAKRPTGKTLPNPAKSSSRSCPHVQAPSPAFLADKGAQPVRRRCSRCYYRLRNQHDYGFGKRWGRKLMAMLSTPSFGVTPSFLHAYHAHKCSCQSMRFAASFNHPGNCVSEILLP